MLWAMIVDVVWAHNTKNNWESVRVKYNYISNDTNTYEKIFLKKWHFCYELSVNNKVCLNHCVWNWVDGTVHLLTIIVLVRKRKISWQRPWAHGPCSKLLITPEYALFTHNCKSSLLQCILHLGSLGAENTQIYQSTRL